MIDLHKYWDSKIEVCGIVTKNGAIQLSNVAIDKATSFLFDKREWMETLNRYKSEIEFVWHTHPSGDPKPSEKDIEVFNKLNFDMVIVGSEGRTYRLTKEKVYA